MCPLNSSTEAWQSTPGPQTLTGPLTRQREETSLCWSSCEVPKPISLSLIHQAPCLPLVHQEAGQSCRTWHPPSQVSHSKACLVCRGTWCTLTLGARRNTGTTSGLSIQADSSLNYFFSCPQQFFSQILIWAELCLQIALSQPRNTLGKFKKKKKEKNEMTAVLLWEHRGSVNQGENVGPDKCILLYESVTETDRQTETMTNLTTMALP